MICKGCNELKPIEHREMMLCATCNRDRRRTVGIQRVYTIPLQSKKKIAREYKLSKVRRAKKKVVKSCQSCDKPEGPLDYSHILPVGMYPEFEAHPDNAVVECRKCHRVWEHGTLSQKMKLKSWQMKLKVILELYPPYFQLLTKRENVIS